MPFQPSAPVAAAVPKTLIPSTNIPAGKVPTNLPLRKELYEGTSKESPSGGVSDRAGSPDESETKTEPKDDAAMRYNCATCGVDCTRQRYHSVKARSFEICTNCYFEGRFPSSMYSGDFVRMDGSVAVSTAEEAWTDQETLLLLEGLEMYDDNWDLISEHVGTRTREQCILKFLKLPIEDPYLTEVKQESLGPLQHQRVPFSQADNPVMTLVAFLASVVNPGVASAAAQAALKELSLATSEEAKEGGDDAMAVDDSKTNGDNNKGGLSTEAVQKAAAVALGAAAAKAKVLADYEEREMQRLVNQAVEMQLKKLEVKMKLFEEMESHLDNEKRELERQRQLLFAEK